MNTFRAIILLLLLSAGLVLCAQIKVYGAPPPLPNLGLRKSGTGKRVVAYPSQGAGAAALVARLAMTVPPAHATNVLPFVFSPTAFTAGMAWNLECTTNLSATWFVAQSNVTEFPTVTYDPKATVRLYRLVGRTRP